MYNVTEFLNQYKNCNLVVKIEVMDSQYKLVFSISYIILHDFLLI